MKELSFSAIGAVSGGTTGAELSVDEIFCGMGGGFLGLALAVNIPMNTNPMFGVPIKLLGCFGGGVIGICVGFVMCHMAFPEDYQKT